MSKMTVRYYWSEDSDPELCSRRDFTASTPGLCYHCDYSIPVGSKASLLRSGDGGYYRMHRTCADKSSTFIEPNA